MIVEITAVPNSKRFSVSLKDGRLKVCLRSVPEHNKANLELVQGLSRLLGRDVALVAGQTSKRKKLEIAMSEAEWAVFLSKLEE
ncbi:MAG: DUF167 domain-containing protein [Candidatus ainarchaeum sp.]|nr:DUF167 domain-containing protein [Candidatus ainarchaeum sp.]